MHIFRHVRTWFGDFKKNRQNLSAPTRTLMDEKDLLSSDARRLDIHDRMMKTDTSGLIPTIYMYVGTRTFKYARGTCNTYDLRIPENESPVQNTR
jgi:hypothetical protein